MTNDRSERRRSRLCAAALLCAVLVSGACGTRASEADKLAARGLANPQPVVQVSNVPTGPDTAGSAGAAAAVPGATPVAGDPGNGANSAAVSAASGSPSVTAGTGKTSTPPAAVSASAPAGTRPGIPSSPGGGGSGAGATKGGNAPGPGASPTPGVPGSPAPSGGPKAPVTIGNVSTLSGPAASGEIPGLDGLQIWVKWVNAKGGASGHLVKLVVADDNSDGARHRQLVQEFVEQKGVIAFAQQGEALTGAGSVDYLTKKGVPVINSEGANEYFYKSPVYFPTTAHGEDLIKASLYNTSEYAKTKHVKKYGLIACTEAQICNDTTRLNGNADNVRAAGMELVYTARTSLAQPDFTAECIGARNAGVEILQISLDGNSVGRVAASCARQNYKPLISVFAAIAFDAMKDNPDLDGLTVNSNAFPYFLCDGGAADYCDAIKRFGPVSLYGIGNANGWTAGKALERALQSAPDQGVTSLNILEGLWTFKDETLGGLTNPLTFTRGQNAPRNPCWWTLIIQNRKFNAPGGMNVRCT